MDKVAPIEPNGRRSLREFLEPGFFLQDAFREAKRRTDYPKSKEWMQGHPARTSLTCITVFSVHSLTE